MSRPEIVTIRKRKRPDGLATWRAYVIGTDAAGTWLFTPKGSRYRGERAGVVGYTQVGQGSRDAGRDILHLAPPGQWWFAAWDPDGVGIDVSTPPVVSDGACEFVDLELDLYLDAAGHSEVVDQDEFDDAVRAGWIDGHERTNAQSTVESLARRLRGLDPLFAVDGRRRHRQLGAAGLPPLDLPTDDH